VPLSHKCPLVILLDCVSKTYCVLLPLICSDVSCFLWPYKSGPSIALCFVCQLRCCTVHHHQFLIFLLINLYSVFLIFPCHLSVLTSNHVSWNLICTFYVQNIPICLLLSAQQITIAVSKLLMVDSKCVCNM
jgi:hypothetical protein